MSQQNTKEGGFTRGLNPNYVTKCRDEWLATVDLRREEANKSDVKRRTGEKSSGNQPKDKRQSRLDFLQETSFEFEVIFIKSLPKFKTELS